MNALITFVSEQDPLATAPEQRESLLIAWKEATETGICRFVKMAVTAPRESGILSTTPSGDSQANGSRSG